MNLDTVLLVDDNPTLLKKIQDIVIHAGYHTITATTGEEAIQKSSQYSPALVFLDIVMQGMDGYAACREIKKIGDIPVVFVSSKDQEADLVWAQKQGGDGYITKPYSTDEITRSLALFLRD